MIQLVLFLSALFGLSKTSGVGHLTSLGAVAPVGHVQQVIPPPVVAAQSSQYFERTFNRLVAAPPVFEPVQFAQVPVQVAPAPVVPVAHAPSVIRVAPAPPVFQFAQPPPVAVEPVTKTVPNIPTAPTQNGPVDPNVAIAVATAHAANPINTILLPPYPFIPQNSIGFIPSVPPTRVPDEGRKESTTPTTVVTQTTPREPEQTTPLPLPSNQANSFAQVLPNQNVNFNQVYGPPPRPQAKPQKLKTSVEVVPVPLRYISPPPLLAHLHHHHHHHPHHGHHHAHIHTFVPAPAKLIVRPVTLRKVRVPVRVVKYRRPVLARNIARSDVARSRDTEPTTFSPNRPNTKPPRV